MACPVQEDGGMDTASSSEVMGRPSDEQEQEQEEVLASASQDVAEPAAEEAAPAAPEEEQREEARQERAEAAALHGAGGGQRSHAWVTCKWVSIIAGASISWTMAVAYLASEVTSCIATKAWQSKFPDLVAEQLSKVVEVSIDQARPESVQQTRLSPSFWISASIIAFALCGAVAYGAWCLVQSHITGKRTELMKKEVARTLTLYYSHQPPDASQWYRLTHIFTGINAAWRAAQTLESPLLFFHGTEQTGWTHKLSLHRSPTTGAVCVQVKSSKAAAGRVGYGDIVNQAVPQTPGPRTPKYQSLRDCYILRIISLGRADEVKVREISLAGGGFLEVLSKAELESGEWTRGDMLIVQIELWEGEWSK